MAVVMAITLSKPDLLILQMELRKETVVQVLQTASENGVTTLLNPAPAQALELEIYKMVSHLVVNETEAAMLADINVAIMTDETEYGHVTDIFLKKEGAERGSRAAVQSCLLPH